MSRRNKYNARRSGGSASGRESRRKWELEQLQKSGAISDLRCQVPFTLIPAQFDKAPAGKRRGKCLERSCVYVADFVYNNQDGIEIVEDSKGFRTRDYVIKRKLMLWLYGIRVIET